MTSRPWREARDEGYELARNRRRRAAAALLGEALDGCRSERAAQEPDGPRWIDLLISESGMLGILVQCQDAADLNEALDTLGRAVAVRDELAGVGHLEATVRHDAHRAMVGLGDVLERRRAALESDAERIDLLTATTGFFDGLVSLLVDLGNPRAALLAAERGRARALADLLTGSEHGRPTGVSEALTADGVRELVSAHGATVVEYWLDTDRGHAWVIRPGDGAIDHIRLAADGHRIRELVTALRSGTELDPDVLTRLHALLVAPLAALLPPDGEAVVLVPHGILHTVPFAALTDADGTPWIARHPLAVLPSLGTVAAAGMSGPRAAAPGRRVLAVAAPAMPAVAPPVGPLPSLDYLRDALPVLTGAAPPDDVTVRSGADATLAELRRLAPGHDLVLLGTHGHADDADATRSFLALAPDGDTHDGLARLDDMSTLGLRARLTVLLACRTGAGPVTGDGVLGLSRAFLLGGARSLVCTLWPVGEQTSTELVHLLLGSWAAGSTSPSGALRAAQLEMCVRYGGQPHLWAGFVLYGSWC